jgi:hypothetical protein
MHHGLILFVLSCVFVCRPNRGFPRAFTARSFFSIYVAFHKTLRIFANDLLSTFSSFCAEIFKHVHGSRPRCCVPLVSPLSSCRFSLPQVDPSLPQALLWKQSNSEMNRRNFIEIWLLSFKEVIVPSLCFADISFHPQSDILVLVMKSKC